jgi:hypothetical protein
MSTDYYMYMYNCQYNSQYKEQRDSGPSDNCSMHVVGHLNHNIKDDSTYLCKGMELAFVDTGTSESVERGKREREIEREREREREMTS